MPYTLYYSPDSANLVVRMALHEMDLPYADVLVNRAFREQKSDSFLAMNPQGLLPVLLDPEQNAPLFETGAILLHLAQTHQRLWPQRHADQGQALKWLFYISNTLHADLRAMFYTERYVADPLQVPALRQGLRPRITNHLQLIDQQIALHQGDWLLGSTLTVCDLYLAVCARWAVIYPQNDALPHQALAQLPNLMALLQRLEQRPAIVAALHKEGIHPDNGQALSHAQVAQPISGSVLG